jgi:DNA-binding NarL/FixJ family response regulator
MALVMPTTRRRKEARLLESDEAWAAQVLSELNAMTKTATAGTQALVASLASVKATSTPDVAATWSDLLHGKLSRVALLREPGTTYVLAVRSEHGRDPRRLTTRELTVAVRCAMGEAHKSIAIDLGLSPVTISTDVASAMAKLGVESRAELVSWFGQRARKVCLPLQVNAA